MVVHAALPLGSAKAKMPLPSHSPQVKLLLDFKNISSII
jgi:hypothetical protein